MSWRNRLRNHLSFRLTVSAVLIVSVGINVAVFALVNALWLRPLPVKDADRIITVLSVSRGWFTPHDFEMFEELAGQVSSELKFEPDLRLPGSQRRLETVGVTPGYFPLFRIDLRGRHLTEGDDRVGAEPVAIISHRLWSQVFDHRDDVIGTVVQTSPVPLRVVGVAPAGFDGARRGERTDVWIPRALFNRVLRVPAEQDLPPFTIWARLRVGDTIADADRRVKESYSRRAAVASLRDVYGTPSQGTVVIGQGRAAGVVAGLALLVLFGGCAAIAALVLVHYERRRVEFGVRAALGASRAQLVSLLAGELAVIGVIGTLGAVAVASLISRLLPSLSLRLPGGVELGRLDGSLDWRVLLAGLSMTAATLTLAACLPIARFTRSRIARDVLQGPATTASVASQRLRQGLLATLVSATVVVLVAAGLFIRAVHRGSDTAVGFEVEHSVFATVPVAPPGLPLQVRSPEFSDTRALLVLDILRALPGVESVAIGSPPIDRSYVIQAQTATTMTVDGKEHRRRVGYLSGSAELLSTLGVKIIAGRPLTALDSGAEPIPTVLTESLAKQLWPRASPLGQALGRHYVVVGVAQDFAFGSLTDPAEGVRVVAQSKNFGEIPRFVIRTQRTDAAFQEEVRRVLQTLLPTAAAPTFLTGRDVVSADLGRQRLGAWFFSGFGLVAILVGTGSVFGLVSYLAESRRREFGIRVALGASAWDLVWQGLSVALFPSGIGLAVGLLLAAALSRVLRAMLVGVSPVDWLTYGTVSIGLLVVTIVAALAAALRLGGVHPVEALKIY